MVKQVGYHQIKPADYLGLAGRKMLIHMHPIRDNGKLYANPIFYDAQHNVLFARALISYKNQRVIAVLVKSLSPRNKEGHLEAEVRFLKSDGSLDDLVF